MRNIIVILILAISSINFLFGQDFSWKKEGEYLQKNIVSWDISPTAEMTLADRHSIYRLDENFNLLFTQSEKGFGMISIIDARHSLKTLLFSEDQQMLGVVDNTLSFQEGRIDLSDLGVDYGVQVCYSDNTNRFWVYDEQNSRLIRFEDLKLSKKQVEITNLSSITGGGYPSSMRENSNHLLLFYEGLGVFVFDYYGSLLRSFLNDKALKMTATESHLFFLEKEKIVRINRTTGNTVEIELPYKKIEDFRIFNQYVYFKDRQGIKKYSLIRGE